MLHIDKIMGIADELGIKIRNDREPGVYDSEGNFESYESAMEGFIEKVTMPRVLGADADEIPDDIWMQYTEEIASENIWDGEILVEREEFHQIYGYGNNTPEQFVAFVNDRKKLGKGVAVNAQSEETR